LLLVCKEVIVQTINSFLFFYQCAGGQPSRAVAVLPVAFVTRPRFLWQDFLPSKSRTSNEGHVGKFASRNACTPKHSGDPPSPGAITPTRPEAILMSKRQLLRTPVHTKPVQEFQHRSLLKEQNVRTGFDVQAAPEAHVHSDVGHEDKPFRPTKQLALGGKPGADAHAGDSAILNSER